MIRSSSSGFKAPRIKQSSRCFEIGRRTLCECYTDIKDDTLWSSDEDLVPVDLNKISGRTFVVYKFGCFVVDLLAVHCQHVPVTLLLAEKLLPNLQLTRNAYRNSFYFDPNNRILYMRSERLETVGEFVLVLIHCLAHLKVQDLRDDTDPMFVKEFHRCLAIVCDDLFFARYRRSSVLDRSVVTPQTGANLERISSEMLENNLAKSSSVRSDVVGDLLDLKLLRGSSKDGVHFSREGLVERLSKYSDFALSNKIQNMLGDIDEKTSQSQLQGTDIYIQDRLQELQGHGSTVRPLSRFAQSHGNLVSRDTAREFSRGFSVSRSTTPYPGSKKRPATQAQSSHEDLYRSFIEVQVNDIQEKVDYLNEDFSEISFQLLELSNNVEELEGELVSKADSLRELAEGSDEHAQKQELLRETAVSLSTKKNLLESLELKKRSCVQRLGLFRNQLQEKRVHLAQYEQEMKQEKQTIKKPETVTKKSKKSK